MLQSDQNQGFPQAEDASTNCVSNGQQAQPNCSNHALSPSPAEQGVDTPAQERRRRRIALVEEFGGHAADLRSAAVKAIERGMYSPRTNRGDIESSLMRTWAHRHRNYNR